MGKKKDLAVLMGISEGEKEGHLGSVEGTEQCSGCEHYMSLGEGHLCMSAPGGGQRIAEIVSWVPGKCDHYLEARSPFQVVE